MRTISAVIAIRQACFHGTMARNGFRRDGHIRRVVGLDREAQQGKIRGEGWRIRPAATPLQLGVQVTVKDWVWPEGGTNNAEQR